MPSLKFTSTNQIQLFL